LNDGSEITPTTAATAIQVDEQSPTRTTVRLRSGSAQFRIRHDSRRLFRVDAGAMEIEDLGTVFRVAHEDSGKIAVAVTEGRVAVLYPASSFRTELGAGESRTFDPPPVSEEALATPKQVPPVSTPPSASAAGPPGTPRARSIEEPAALLLAADFARRSGKPQAAVAPLRRLVDKYPRDPRAPSAAFTLGWVLLTDLGRPREAAAAFAEAERHAPRGMLAEDAAARVAEAWQRAGDSHRAAQAARHYEQLYPTGRHLPLMHALVGEP
jgi:transmembrane sensor